MYTVLYFLGVENFLQFGERILVLTFDFRAVRLVLLFRGLARVDSFLKCLVYTSSFLVYSLYLGVQFLNGLLVLGTFSTQRIELETIPLLSLLDLSNVRVASLCVFFQCCCQILVLLSDGIRLFLIWSGILRN